MSSSQPFIGSSPLSALAADGGRRRSKFTFRQLSQLAQYNAFCPLRVIALIDLDAFYAQCEMVRLGVSEDQPLGVQQWQGLIAINYPARKFGLGRHITPVEAKKLCPEIILQHVATWEEGDEKWAYREDAWKHIATQKVSLDPYRMESKKILATIKEALAPPPLQRVEKASIDEVFIDLSAQVHSILLDRYPELNGPPPYDDPTENLPRPPVSALDWNTDHVIDLDQGQTEDDDPDWDDICFCIGSEIIRDVRKAVRDKLHYTMSGGISRNKMIAKLGAGFRKPNQQTVVRNRAVQHFLSDVKFTKIRNLGGKLGDEVVAMFNTDTVKELLDIPLEGLRKLGDDTGSWLYNTIRGEDHSEVSVRTQIKSMLSAKSFRPSINSFEQGVRWLRIFAADIFSRCVEEGVLENKRRPKTINLHHRQGGQMRSRQTPIPQGKPLTEQTLFELSKGLFAQVIADGRAWPCANLSLSVGGFEDGITNNKGIGGFLVYGDEARAMIGKEGGEDNPGQNSEIPAPKRRKLDNSTTLNKFFVPRDDSKDSATDREEEEPPTHDETEVPYHLDGELPPSAQRSPHLKQRAQDSFFCSRCNSSLPETKGEHEDWHFAKDLAEEMAAQDRSELATSRTAVATPKPAPNPKGRGRPPSGPLSNKVERGQRTLAFGKQ